MDNKSNYIKNIRDKLKSNGILVSDRQSEDLIDRFVDTSKSMKEIEKDIDFAVKDFLEKNELFPKSLLPPKKVKSLKNIPVKNLGITLNSQQIDLMMIANSENPYELQEVLSKITIIPETISTLHMSKEEFLEIRQKIFDEYISLLQSPLLENKLPGMIDYLSKYSGLSNDKMNIVARIIKQNSSLKDVIKELLQIFDKDFLHNILKNTRQYSATVEKVGVAKTSLQGYRNLYQEVLKNYNRITLDAEVKYGCVVLPDNTFEFKYLQKALDFAKSINKGVKLNALCFYYDFPSKLSGLDKNGENKQLVKETFMKYIDGVTNFISEYQQENGNIIENIDVLNELLNMFALKSNPPYDYRGNIPQSDEFDVNTFSGWQKYLDLEDLCEVISIARRNLKDTGITFTYNETNLEDPIKIECLKNIIVDIQRFEQDNGVKLIDSIGTQMHINSTITKEEIKQELIELGKIGYPIEITEFDMMILPEVSSNLTLEQIENIKQSKLNDFCDVITEIYQQVNLRGVTIWSVNDDQNFMIEVENKKLLDQGLLPNVDTVYGGYYNKDMLPRYEEYIKSKLNDSNLTFEQIGRGTVQSFSQNPKEAMTAFQALEKGVEQTIKIPRERELK